MIKLVGDTQIEMYLAHALKLKRIKRLSFQN